MEMPSLGDIPQNEDEEPKRTPSLEGEAEKRELKNNKQRKVLSENAASFGNNVVTKPGINPSSASFVKKENHKGFHGRDQIVKQKKKKKKKNGVTKKKVRNSKDKEVMSKLKNVAKKIAEVEHKKERNALKDEKKKQEMKSRKESSNKPNEKDISTLNSLGRANISRDLLSNNKGK